MNFSISSDKNELKEDNIRLLKTKDDWKQFIELIRENFPEDINKVKEEGIEYHTHDEHYLFGYFRNEELLGTILALLLVLKQKMED